MVVADGTVYPYPKGIIHSIPLVADHLKVSLDLVYPAHMDVMLPVPHRDGETSMVGQARGHILMWQVDCVLFDEV